MSASRSCSNNESVPKTGGEVLEIEQCLFPVPEEFFLQEETLKEDECISIELSESLNIPCVPPYTKLEELLGEDLTPEVIEKLCFSEMLLISAANDELVGGLAIQVETIADEVIAIFYSSQFSIGDDKTARCELLSLTDKQFNPFQERKCESILAGDFKQEKQLQVYFDEELNVTAFRQETVADKSESFQGTLEANEDGILIPDGLNILFMRYLILTDFTGDIHTRTIDIQGRVGQSIYQITGPSPIRLNGEIHDSKQVIRTIYYSDTDEPEISISYYLRSGRLLRHSWNNSNYSIVMNTKSTLCGLPVDMSDLCSMMCVYLEELAKLLEGSPDEAGRCSTILPRPTEIVRAVLSEILNETTKTAISRRQLTATGATSTETVREVLVEIINLMSLL